MHLYIHHRRIACAPDDRLITAGDAARGTDVGGELTVGDSAETAEVLVWVMSITLANKNE